MSLNILKNSAINIFFTRVCNYECKFCFHTKKSSSMLSLKDQFKILSLLKEAGAEKMNFAGGEPFLFPDILGELVMESKRIGYDSVSIISNGSKVKRSWFERYHQGLDILGVSCDTTNAMINYEHGRCVAGSNKPKDETNSIKKCAELAHEYGIMFKVNTVVTSLNKDEDMSQFINELNPMRWKVFQVLDVEGENYNDMNSKSELWKLLISEQQFKDYVDRNREGLINKEILKAESNTLMRDSYILIDEYGRFLDTSTGGKIPTKSILEVGLEAALEQLISSNGGGYNEELFQARGGYYPESWSKNRI